MRQFVFTHKKILTISVGRTYFFAQTYNAKVICLFVLGFYGPVNNEVMSSQSVNSGTAPGQA